MSAVLSPSAVQSWQAEFDAQPNVNTVKREAFASFLTRGLPTTKLDAWKYTDLRRLALRQFRLAAPDVTHADVEELLLAHDASLRYVFVDGALLSKSSAASSTNETAEPKARADAFNLLNMAFSSNSVKISIAAGQTIAQPIYLAFVWTKDASAQMMHPRIQVSLAANSQATLVEHHLGLNTEANFTNAVIDIAVGDNAALEHIRVQDDAVANFNIGSVHATVARGGSYVSHQYLLGGGLTRTDINVQLAGAAAQTELHGLIFAQNTQHLDVRTVIDHQVPNTRSVEDYRGIAEHRGRVVFNGKVIVSKDAQKTDARQSSRNLLLSPHAEIDTRPELEIYANDVKCAHGATVGQLDNAALFYLQSRGIEHNEARALLTQAFAAEIIERIPVPEIRAHVLARLMSRMRVGAAS